MRKSRAILLLIATVIVIGGYVAWAAWEPAPTLQSIKYRRDVDAAARSAVEADFREHPPKGWKLTWQGFLNRLIHPYQPRKEPSIRVSIISLLGPTGIDVLEIKYPRESVFLGTNAMDRKDGRWVRIRFRSYDSRIGIIYEPLP